MEVNWGRDLHSTSINLTLNHHLNILRNSLMRPLVVQYIVHWVASFPYIRMNYCSIQSLVIFLLIIVFWYPASTALFVLACNSKNSVFKNPKQSFKNWSEYDEIVSRVRVGTYTSYCQHSYTYYRVSAKSLSNFKYAHGKSFSQGQGKEYVP